LYFLQVEWRVFRTLAISRQNFPRDFMQQRQLRLGDLLDDYCPRERRVTNHAVVAMVDDQVKQTRCTTCDAEHEYKGARVPVRRKKESTGALYSQVLKARKKEEGGLPVTDEADVPPPLMNGEPPHADVSMAAVSDAATAQAERNGLEDDNGVLESDAARPAEGPVHRRLIRATLPRVEGQVTARPVPEFTVRRAAGRQHAFRGKSFRPSGDMHGGQGRGFSGARSGGGSPQGRGGRPPGGPGFHAKGGHAAPPRHGRPHPAGRKKH
jgi:hypothetical protein